VDPRKAPIRRGVELKKKPSFFRGFPYSDEKGRILPLSAGGGNSAFKEKLLAFERKDTLLRRKKPSRLPNRK